MKNQARRTKVYEAVKKNPGATARDLRKIFSFDASKDLAALKVQGRLIRRYNNAGEFMYFDLDQDPKTLVKKEEQPNGQIKVEQAEVEQVEVEQAEVEQAEVEQKRDTNSVDSKQSVESIESKTGNESPYQLKKIRKQYYEEEIKRRTVSKIEVPVLRKDKILIAIQLFPGLSAAKYSEITGYEVSGHLKNMINLGLIERRHDQSSLFWIYFPKKQEPEVNDQETTEDKETMPVPLSSVESKNTGSHLTVDRLRLAETKLEDIAEQIGQSMREEAEKQERQKVGDGQSVSQQQQQEPQMDNQDVGQQQILLSNDTQESSEESTVFIKQLLSNLDVELQKQDRELIEQKQKNVRLEKKLDSLKSEMDMMTTVMQKQAEIEKKKRELAELKEWQSTVQTECLNISSQLQYCQTELIEKMKDSSIKGNSSTIQGVFSTRSPESR